MKATNKVAIFGLTFLLSAVLFVATGPMAFASWLENSVDELFLTPLEEYSSDANESASDIDPRDAVSYDPSTGEVEIHKYADYAQETSAKITNSYGTVSSNAVDTFDSEFAVPYVKDTHGFK